MLAADLHVDQRPSKNPTLQASSFAVKMRTSKLWITIVVASSSVPAYVAAAIARDGEGLQEQLKEGSASKLLAARIMATEIEEVELRGGT